jgi:hypothetical protein
MLNYLKTLFSRRALVAFAKLLVLVPWSILTARFRYHAKQNEQD